MPSTTGPPSGAAEVRDAVVAATQVVSSNQATPTTETPHPDTESAFTTEVCDTYNT